MPCYDNYDYETPQDKQARIEARKRLDEVAYLFCETCHTLERMEGLPYLSDLLSEEALAWWKDHKIADAKRKSNQLFENKMEEIEKNKDS